MLFQNSKFKIQKERLHLQLQLSRLGEGSLDVRAPSRQKAWAAVELGHKGAGQFPRRAPVIETLNASRSYDLWHPIDKIARGKFNVKYSAWVRRGAHGTVSVSVTTLLYFFLF